MAFTQTSNTQGGAPSWGRSFVTQAATTARIHPVLPPSLRTSKQLLSAQRCFGAALLAELGNPEVLTKQGATAKAKTFLDLHKAIVHFVAKTPTIAGDVRGVSIENAQMYATEVRGRFLEACHSNPSVVRYLKSEIGWATLSLATTSYADLVSGMADVANEHGQITMREISTATQIKAQYYPPNILAILSGVQEMYDKRPLPEGSEVLRPILEGTPLSDAGTMNGGCGHVQCTVPLLNSAILALHPSLYRRDDRPVYDGSGAQVQLDSKVLALSTYVMRAVLQSALEMSIALGHVTKTTRGGAIGTTGPKTTYFVRRDTPFAALLELAIRTKRYYNPAGTKDLVALVTETGAHHTIHTEAPAWKSLVITPDGYKFQTASLVLEVETRLRIAEYNNEPAVIPGPGQQAPPKPNSKEVKTPNFTFFARNPRELIDASAIAARTNSWAEFREEAGLRQDTARRLAELYKNSTNDGRDHRAFAGAIEAFAAQIVTVCTTINLIHISRAIAASTEHGSTSKARFEKIPRS